MKHTLAAARAPEREGAVVEQQLGNARVRHRGARHRQVQSRLALEIAGIEGARPRFRRGGVLHLVQEQFGDGLQAVPGRVVHRRVARRGAHVRARAALQQQSRHLGLVAPDRPMQHALAPGIESLESRAQVGAAPVCGELVHERQRYERVAREVERRVAVWVARRERRARPEQLRYHHVMEGALDARGRRHEQRRQPMLLVRVGIRRVAEERARHAHVALGGRQM